MPTNHGGFADDNASPVVDKKTFADLRSGMNIDRRLRMRDLRNDPREHRDTQQIELVRETMTNDRGDARVTATGISTRDRGRAARLSHDTIVRRHSAWPVNYPI